MNVDDINEDIFSEMKAFFKVSSLEDVAEKLGYSRNTANTWRSRGISENAVLKFNKVLMDANNNSGVMVGGHNIGSIFNNKENDMSDEFKKFMRLFEEYGNKALLKKYIKELQTIKETMEE